MIQIEETDEGKRSGAVPEGVVEPPSDAWLMLIHQLPPEPAYLRVKVGRRLYRAGAALLKNSVYVLPAGEPQREDLTWIAREIATAGGEAVVCETRLVAGLDDAALRDLFRRARNEEYTRIADEARAALESVDTPDSEAERLAQMRRDLARLRRRLAETADLDFFAAAGRGAAEAQLLALEGRLRAAQSPTAGAASGSDLASLRGHLWVTRAGVHVDRMASAWLIRRFVDPDASFRFVRGRGYRPRVGEVRFDMFEAEFTHEGDACTFEVLLARSGLHDPALDALAEIVHDLDLKDGKYQRPEAAGLERLIAGITMTQAEDKARLARGAALFDDLYAFFRGVGHRDS
ncbi:MAG: chromate resistance protein [Candidatus Lambdaproteobacteria bacterium]|nr:chromate resistance protein [Candidatus Lambdaproteobacteria bacterium]